MYDDDLPSRARRFGVAGAALLMGLLPVAFPHWISTLAEAYFYFVTLYFGQLPIRPLPTCSVGQYRVAFVHA